MNQILPSQHPERSSDLLDSALRYAELGFSIIPLHSSDRRHGCSCPRGRQCHSPAKHPRTVHGLSDASTDPQQVGSWWGKWPDANIGVITGGPIGLVVVDVDPRNAGTSTLERLLREHGRLPATPAAITGGRGLHYYFAGRGDIRSRPGGLGTGVDVKAAGGYVVAPPSSHASGASYTWLDGNALGDIPLAPLPNWIEARLNTRPVSNLSTLSTARVLAGVTQGQRDQSLWWLACKLRGAGVPQGAAEVLVLKAAANCQPPFSAELALDKVRRAYLQSVPTSTPPILVDVHPAIVRANQRAAIRNRRTGRT